MAIIGQLNGLDIRDNLEEMQIGDLISCEYVANSGVVGTFANLGTATKDLIPVTGSATPNGSFYFVKVDDGLLVADRTIQHSINWDTLNAGKMIEGTPLLGGLIRSLSGGVAYLDVPSLVPKLTSNTAPSGLAFASSIYNSTYDSWKAFDGLEGGANEGRWSTSQGSIGDIGYIGYKFNTLTLVDTLYISAYTDGELKDLKIQASNDTVDGSDGTWEDLAIGLNVGKNSSKLIKFNNIQSYRAYRIIGNYYLASDGNYYYGVRELKFFNQESFRNGNPSATNQGLGAYPSINEWDKYIVGSDLGGKIVAGDDNVWHWSNLKWGTLCKETPSLQLTNAISSRRICRGTTGSVASLKGLMFDSSNTITVFEGFRPVLQLQNPKQANLFY